MTSRTHTAPTAPREDFSEYVAHLQLHMTLQTRKLVPNMAQAVHGNSSHSNDSRAQLLQYTQAQIEKQVSRQIF